MTMIAAMTRFTYRYTLDGRRVYVPFAMLPHRGGRLCYVVDQASAARFERRLGWSFVLTIVALPLIVVTLDPDGVWLLFGAIAVPLILIHGFAVRRLARVTLQPHELRSIEWRGRVRSLLLEIGEPAIWLGLLLSLALTAAGVWFVSIGGATWGAWVFLLLCIALSTLMVSAIYVVRVSRPVGE